MAEITASMVKELRELTGAGMMDCKILSDNSNLVNQSLLHGLRSILDPLLLQERFNIGCGRSHNLLCHSLNILLEGFIL